MSFPISDNNKTTLPIAIDEVKKVDQSLHRRRVSLDELRFVDGELGMTDELLALDEPGYRRLCNEVRAPYAYISRFGSDLRSRILTHHLANDDLKSGHRGGNVTVYWRNGTFVGFGRADLTTLRAADALYSVQDAIGDELGDKADNIIVHRLRVRDEEFELDLASPDISEELRPGDVMQAGLRVSHSLLGEQATRIESFVLRLACQNGLLRRECVNKAAVRLRRCTTRNHDAVDHQLGQIKTLTRRVIRGLGDKLQSIRALTEQRVNTRDFLDRQLRQVPRLHSRKLLNALLAAWNAEGKVSTAYAALNAITWVASHAPDELVGPRQRHALALLAGVIASSSQHICPKCYTVIGT